MHPMWVPRGLYFYLSLPLSVSKRYISRLFFSHHLCWVRWDLYHVRYHPKNKKINNLPISKWVNGVGPFRSSQLSAGPGPALDPVRNWLGPELPCRLHDQQSIGKKRFLVLACFPRYKYSSHPEKTAPRLSTKSLSTRTYRVTGLVTEEPDSFRGESSWPDPNPNR